MEPNVIVMCDDYARNMAEPYERIPKKALAIYAHPDDADVSCGGTLARWAARGCEVHVVICASGEKGSSDPAHSVSEIKKRRRSELAASAKVLDAKSFEILGHSDGEFDNTVEPRRQLVSIIRKTKPEVVVCPDPTSVFFGDSYFNHRDHRVVGWAVLDSVSPAVSSPHYFPDDGSPHTVNEVLLSGSFAPDIWIDIEDFVSNKVDALLCHESQLREAPDSVKSAVTQRAEQEGRMVNLSRAESFRRLRLS